MDLDALFARYAELLPLLQDLDIATSQVILTWHDAERLAQLTMALYDALRNQQALTMSALAALVRYAPCEVL
jgi:hypothetical protein